MNILFLTLQYDFAKENEYLSKSRVPLQSAANTFQYNLLSGFHDLPCDVTIMNTLPMAPYPNYKQLVMPTKTGSYLGFNYNEIGYFNIPIIKQFSRFLKYKRQVEKWILSTPGDKCVIAYSLYLPFEKVFKFLKKKYPEVKTGIICTDLPCEYGILPKNKLLAWVQNRFGKKSLNYAKYCDFFSVLTDKMKEPLNIANRPYTVIEGIANGTSCSIPGNGSLQKVILYTGTLHREYGILTLLEAFSLIEDYDIKLWICGDGNARVNVEQAAENDNRITYFGYISKDAVNKLIQKSSILINPRSNEGEYTKYSFPSKTMEYMLSAKPVVMYKLDGIPNEYDEHLFYINGNTPNDMKNTILDVFRSDSDEILQRAKNASDFILKYKNSNVQAKKLFDLLVKLWD